MDGFVLRMLEDLLGVIEGLRDRGIVATQARALRRHGPIRGSVAADLASSTSYTTSFQRSRHRILGPLRRRPEIS
eukprot:scaffold1823_cov196-Pinguiococcus_pyrenoidosus.AAC.1